MHHQGHNGSGPARAGTASSLRRRRWADRAATLAIAGGGISVVLAILLIFVFVGREALPLAMGSRLGDWRALGPAESRRILLVGADSFQDLAWRLTDDGLLTVTDRVMGGERAWPLPLDSLERPTAWAMDGGRQADRFLVGTSAGRLFSCRVVVRRLLDEGPDRSEAELHVESPALPGDSLAAAAPVEELAWARGEAATVVAWSAGGRLRVVMEDPDTGAWEEVALPGGGVEVRPERIAVAPSAERLALALAGGALLVLDLEGGAGEVVDTLSTGLDPVDGLTFLTGSGRLVAGGGRGELRPYVFVKGVDGMPHWRPGPALAGHGSPLRLLLAGPRDRTLLSLDTAGEARLHYGTTGRGLLVARVPGGASAAAFGPRGDALLLGTPAGVQAAPLDNAHPEISWRALFGRLAYEGYDKPQAVWQSTGGSDDFEAKLSVLPLIFGTLKGTLFALLISVPLALLGAIYISQFAPTWLARTIKPAIEIMAALPSVIVGFLAGLVFAPYLEEHLTAVLAFAVVLPLLILALVPAWQRLPGHRLGARGLPQLAQGLVVALAALALAYGLAPWLDARVFGGSLVGWLHEHGGIVYDQRNSLVVGFALGFAVIPIIFTMAEDALSNVPESLISASLALGASRWTTVARVVLPGAAAGVFAAIMIGLGRAIGETMIVLMATGNTPLMDISPFNGFRALSACIAVEIPEAPVGGTLYRLLFLLALLLFAFTLAINTAASWIGERLRKTHGRF